MSEKYRLTKNLLGGYTVHYECPQCGVRLKSPISDAGGEDRCPDCNKRFTVPGVDESRQISEEQLSERLRKKEAAQKRDREQRKAEEVAAEQQNTIDKPPFDIRKQGLTFWVAVLAIAVIAGSILWGELRMEAPGQSEEAKIVPPTPGPVFTQKVVEDLAAALDRGHVVIEAASGTGASTGLVVDAYLINQRNTEVSLDISLKQPLFLRNRGRGQNMIAIKVYLRGGAYRSDGIRSFISLEPKLRIPVQFVAYCVDFDKDNPSNTEEFVRDASPVSLLPLFQSISNYESSHPNQDITIAAQAAIWLAQGVSIKDVRTKFEVNHAQETLAREFLK